MPDKKEEKLADFKFVIALLMQVPQMLVSNILLANKLIAKCSLETLNARTIYKGKLFCLVVCWGLVDLVKLLVEMGVDLDTENCCVENDAH